MHAVVRFGTAWCPLVVVWLHVSLQAAPLALLPFCNMRPWSREFSLQKMKRRKKNCYRWGFNDVNCCLPANVRCIRRLHPSTHHQGSQDMAYWHNWWNQLSGFQRQLILVMSMVDDFWSNLTEGQRTVTGNTCRSLMLLFCSCLTVSHVSS